MLTTNYARLKSFISPYSKVLVAFSGGVDSALLLKAVTEECRGVGVAIKSDFFPDQSGLLAQANEIGAILYFIDMPHDFLTISNPDNRCYLCKKEIFGLITPFGKSKGFDTIFDGSNYDDLAENRPGKKAAIEYNIISPLEKLHFTKLQIRQMAEEQGVMSYNKPSRPCLLTRFPHNMKIDIEILRKIEIAENFIDNLGIKNFRLRFFEDIEGIGLRLVLFDDEFDRIMPFRKQIAEMLKSMGFKRFVMDMFGY